MLDSYSIVSFAGRLLLLVLIGIDSHVGLAAAFRIEKGVLDLRSWDPKSDPVIELRGEAEFHWQNFLVSDPKPESSPEFREISKPWNYDHKHPALGFASYRVRIMLPTKAHDKIQLFAVPAMTRSRVYVNRMIQAEFGIPRNERPSPDQEERYNRREKLLSLPTDVSDIELIYEISNWDVPQIGGFWNRAPSIGFTAALEEDARRDFGVAASFIAICLTMGIYHLFLFALRREDKSNLFFALMAFSTILYFSAIAKSFPLDIVDALWSYRASNLLYTLGWFINSVALFYFVSHIFPDELQIKRAHLFAVLTLPFVLLVTSLRPHQYIPLLGFFQLLALSAFVYILFCVTRSVKNRRQGAGIFLFIAGVAGLASVHDMLLASGVIESRSMVVPSSLVFLLGQSALLSMRFAHAFRQVQVLSNEIIEKEKARTVFFHNTSHELRTPLNGILGFLDLVRGGHYGAVPDKVRIQIDKAWRLAESLKIQVNTILDLAKSRRGDLRLTVSTIDLSQLKKDCDVLAEGLQLKFPGTQYASQLDDLAGTRRWHGDREKILTMIRNLLGNAFKFCSPERPNQVTLVIEHRQGELLIRVSDQGIGIAPEDQPKIFEEFNQAQSDARRAYEGTGLGLAMVRDLVKLSEGSIQVESTLGKGSVFLVRLPELALSNAVEAQTAQEGLIHVSEVRGDGNSVQSLAAGQSAAIKAFASQFRLLVVDDNPTNLEVIQDILSLDGYQIDLADGGKKALKSLETQIPDLLILDLMMPEVSGEDVLRAVRSNPQLKDLPIIILTARASDQDRIATLGLGADEYMSKPFDPRELSLRVYNTLERRELQREALDTEHRQRLSELGELFSDLSHELKNIFQLPHREPQKLNSLFPQLWNRPDLSPGTQNALQKLFEAPGEFSNRFAVLGQMNKIALQKWPKENRKKAARVLAFSALDDASMLDLWQALQELPETSFASLEDQLDMSEQFVNFQLALYRGRDLALSALDLERMGQVQGRSQLREVVKSIETLMQARLRKAGVELRSQIPALELPIAPGVLQQVLINILGNACDAMSDEPVSSRWIMIEYREDRGFYQLRISNAGAKIDPLVAKQLFRRGFSTKGKRGSGLGLSLSQRLVREQGGDLRLDLEENHTTFVISFAKMQEGKPA